jgi:hypothetical protein
MGDFDATLQGNEGNFHTTIVTLDPLLTQLNGTLAIVSADSQSAIGQINTNNRQLQPELVSAVSQTDGQGHLLRQFLVASMIPCDQANANPSQCHSSGPQPTTGLAVPTLPSLPALPLPSCLPTPSPPKLPTPTISPLPCPSIAPSATPKVPCMPATPTPPKLPTPSPSLSLCPSLPGVSLPPLGTIPDWLGILLGGAPQ